MRDRNKNMMNTFQELSVSKDMLGTALHKGKIDGKIEIVIGLFSLGVKITQIS